MALLPSKEVRAIVQARPPFAVVHINDQWAKLYNKTQTEVEGVPFCEIVHAPVLQAEQLINLASECAAGKPIGAVALVHSRADKTEPALIYMKLFPLTRTDKNITHLLVVQADLPLTQAEASAVRQHLHGSTSGSEKSSSSRKSHRGGASREINVGKGNIDLTVHADTTNAASSTQEADGVIRCLDNHEAIQ